MEQRLTPEGVELVRTRHGNPLLLHESLPASAWEDKQFRKYVPVGYAACFFLHDPNKLGAAQTSSVVAPPIEQLLAVLPTSAADLLRGRLTVPAVRGSSDAQYDCLALTTDDARRLDRALADAGVEGGTDEHMLWYHLEYVGQDGTPLEMKHRLRARVPRRHHQLLGVRLTSRSRTEAPATSPSVGPSFSLALFLNGGLVFARLGCAQASIAEAESAAEEQQAPTSGGVRGRGLCAWTGSLR